MIKFAGFFTFSLLIVTVSSEKFRFDNYTLYKLLPENDNQIAILQDLQRKNVNFDFWNVPVPKAEFVNVMSSPKDKSVLEGLLTSYGIKYEKTIPNIQEAIEKQTVKSYTRNNVRSMTWDAYYTLDDIEAWMDDLATTYPSIITKIVGGVSYENRTIKGVRLSHGSGRRIIFLEAGLHSREWITVPTVCYILNELLTSDDEETRAAARDFDWYVIPVANPDGYVWSHENFRMWRKNRRPVGQNIFGVDLNRNWNSNWLIAGSSTNPNSDAYAGPGPFSEPETRSLSRYLRSIGDRIDIYLSFHSFSHLLLIPFGNSTAPYANYDEAINIGRRAMGALSVRYGTIYSTGNIAEAIYLATGGAIDWVKEQLNVPLVYCYELRDNGTYGFLLPPDQILPNNLETMDSIIELIHQAKRFGAINSGTAIQVSLIIMIFGLLTQFL